MWKTLILIFCALLAGCKKRPATDSDAGKEIAKATPTPTPAPTPMPKIPVDTLESILEAATRGDAAAQAKLGAMFADGTGGAVKDEAKAIEWLRKAAAQGETSAQARLGAMFAEGKCAPKDQAEAVAFMEKAVAAGNAATQDGSV